MTHLSEDKTVAKMGHPVVVVRSDVGHPSLGHPFACIGFFSREVRLELFVLQRL
jgi:hypothetical protein